MAQPFWQLQELSDEQLLRQLAQLQEKGRHLTAELVAHLAEVEHRRLHLHAACGSLFEYCVSRLGLSEDEACRRIEAARLARRFPELFALLANGEVSLSVAALLKPHLREDNCHELLQAVAGQSVRRARELLAAHFPQPDVRSSVRKLPAARGLASANSPERAETKRPSTESEGPGEPPATLAAANEQLDKRSSATGTVAATTLAAARANPNTTIYALTPTSALSANTTTSALTPTTSALAANTTNALTPGASTLPASATTAATTFHRIATATTVREARRRARIEPLSAERYRVQFTAGVSLKQKLEFLQDLMRHQNPSGDLAPIVERALELLIDQQMKQRFGRTARATATAKAAASRHASVGSAMDAATAPDAVPGVGAAEAPQPAPPRPLSVRVGNATRRAVSSRDGLCCSWADANGKRCASRAWLEFDHRVPRGKGGSSEVENVRLLCRAHNQLSAELHYGRAQVEGARRHRRERSHDQEVSSA
ncbi:MAG TPA: HNH endonuclease signature motif containing protein [Polyangiaceae bacterium]|nr:HNH endonuclease signature motif containing protein [Polyangiaceae bacterium]